MIRAFVYKREELGVNQGFNGIWTEHGVWDSGHGMGGGGLWRYETGVREDLANGSKFSARMFQFSRQDVLVYESIEILDFSSLPRNRTFSLFTPRMASS